MIGEKLGAVSGVNDERILNPQLQVSHLSPKIGFRFDGFSDR